MRKLLILVLLSCAGICVFAAAPRMPRFQFENFTTAIGLPDNHVFAVLADGAIAAK